MSTKRCCCSCPLIANPWRTAKLEFLGMTFDVEFPEEPSEACCQQEVSVCKDIGPMFIGDCYLGADAGYSDDWYEPVDGLLDPLGDADKPWCDWRLITVPYTAVDSCCGSWSWRSEVFWRARRRFWVWIQAKVKFIICYCLTDDGKPGYRMRIEIDWQIIRIQNSSELQKIRWRKYTRVCCDDPGDGDGGTTTSEPIIP
jgi:hypothetical protein